MYIDLSTKELKVASTAFTVAIEIAKERLGEGEYAGPRMLLRDLTTEQLDEFVRYVRSLKNGFDLMLADEPGKNR